MKLIDHLPSAFSLSDALDPHHTEQLMSASHALEVRLPLSDASAGRAARERADRARAERARQLREALDLATVLLTSSGYDLQVLTVALRLSVEVEGLDGCEQALRVLARALGDGWSELSTQLSALPERERERRRRKWSRYVDAVLEQMYLWLAREQQEDEPSLRARFAGASDVWAGLLGEVRKGLTHTTLSASRFDDVERLIADLGLATSAAARPTPPDGSAAPLAPSSEASGEPAGTDAGAASDGGRNAVCPAASGASADVPSTSAVLHVSERFWDLQRRLSAFRQLLERAEYEKAGIVASDLRENVERFDVAAVFPGLFASFFEGCAEHAAALLSHQPDPRELRASALASLYRTDLERFLALRSTSKTK